MTRLRRLLCFFVSHIVPPIIAIGVVGPLGFWYFDSDPPLTVHAFRILTPEVERGGNLSIEYDATFHRRCSGAGRRTFVDVTHFRMPINPYFFRFGIAADGKQVDLGERHVYPIEATVPDAAAPGPATYQNVTEFYCNPLQIFLRGSRFERSITFRYPVIYFTISDRRVAKIVSPKTLFKPIYEDPQSLEDLPTTTPPSPSQPSDADDLQKVRR